MPSVEENYQAWNETYPWKSGGDEWSQPWGSAANQWYALILPRIYHFLPAEHILEIAPGYGRWTQFLAQQATVLSVVDLSEKCITQCRERFAQYDHLRYYVNDGKSLSNIADDSVDFVFSFDSLVHADMHIIQAYISEIRRVLRSGGAAVIHHSNLGASRSTIQWKILRRLRKILRLFGLRFRTSVPHWRDSSVSAVRVREAANAIGLTCSGQEIFKWLAATQDTDCISVFRKTSGEHVQPLILENQGFQTDVETARNLLRCYGKPDSKTDKP